MNELTAMHMKSTSQHAPATCKHFYVCAFTFVHRTLKNMAIIIEIFCKVKKITVSSNFKLQQEMTFLYVQIQVKRARLTENNILFSFTVEKAKKVKSKNLAYTVAIFLQVTQCGTSTRDSRFEGLLQHPYNIKRICILSFS